ncbi:MAG: M24 family metallopeptidase [Acidimicrobiales bacterium]
MSPPAAVAPFVARSQRVREAMGSSGVDVTLLSVGADLPWLTGYSAMPLERLTMLVVPPAPVPACAVLVVPALEAPRARPVPEAFSMRPWGETEDPVEVVASLVRDFAPFPERCIAVSDRTWAMFLLQLQERLPGNRWVPASAVMAPLRAVKDAQEVEALARAAASADRVARALLGGEVPLVGRSERDISVEIGQRLIAEGHDRVNFAIVASGPNAASPHHEPGERTVQAGEPVVCDFGGSLAGYCSDMTRTVFTGPPPPELAHVYEVVAEAQAAGVAAARVGSACHEVDAAARRVISQAGLGEYFMHRTGHGIGLEEHEPPYMVTGNYAPILAGNAFSVEPGVYLPGRWGVRIEDIVVATPEGPRTLNQASRALSVVEA